MRAGAAPPPALLAPGVSGRLALDLPEGGRFGLDGVRLAAPAFRLPDALDGLGGAGPEPPPPPAPKLFDRKTTLATVGFFAAIPIVGYYSWWKVEEKVAWHVDHEGWFDPDTYTGGADKVSHFVVSSMVEELMEGLYRGLGKSDAQARLLAFSAVSLGGLLVEVGDGFTRYGFSPEDAVTNTLGAFAWSQVGRLGLRDTIGLRFGRVKYMIPDPCCRALGYGADYSKEVYSADLILNGFLPRVGVKPGPARFLLVSLTYGSKGYRFSPVDHRERNIGLDIGLNLPEVLKAVGVKESTWWGRPLLFLFRWFRLPYTAFGFHYDFNHRHWYGWDTGDAFDPGSVIYD